MDYTWVALAITSAVQAENPVVAVCALVVILLICLKGKDSDKKSQTKPPTKHKKTVSGN